MATRKLLIIDGYSLLFRAFYATRMLSTSDGRPTNALFGFTSMLFQLIQTREPECIVVALDAHEKTFRHIEYPEYKGTRRETPDELIQQLVASREFIAALGIPTLEAPGYEADDVVGTLSLVAESRGYHTDIITGDLDALQLVDDFVRVITPRQGVGEVATYDPEAVLQRFGFGPEFIPDYKALVGDSSDNIPGVPGIGDKSATKLIQQFGSVEQIIARLPEVEEKFRKKLEPALDQIPRSKWLATIVRDVPLEFSFEPFQVDQAHLDQATRFLESYEMKSLARRVGPLLGRYGGDGMVSVPMVEVVEEPLPDLEAKFYSRVEEVAGWVEGQDFALIFAPKEPNPNLLEVSDDEAWICIGNQVGRMPSEVGRELFRSHPDQAILHDAKPLYRGGPLRPAPCEDTMIAAYVLQSGRSSYALRDLVQGYLDVLPPQTPSQCAFGLYRLASILRDRLGKEDQLRVYDELERPLVPILAEMEHAGIRVSRELLVEFSEQLRGEILEAQRSVWEHAGQEFTIASPKQLGEVLFEKLGLPGGKKGKTGWSTGAEILQEMDHPIARAVLHFRELSKLRSTYADALPRMIGPDGRIHTTLNQTVAATGRLSSNEPNLQNIPIRTDLGRTIRRAFIAEEGFSLASFDYSQIDLRVLAHLCQDEPLVEAFRQRVDVHTVTAALMFHVDQGQVTKDQRRLAKMLNYAVLYGVSDFGLAQQLGEGFDVKQARELIKQYNERFPKVKAFTDGVVEDARKTGFTRTPIGRRRYFPDIHAQNRNDRMYAERQAMNAPIQGGSADMIKLAMLRVRETLGSRPTRMLLQVHDELVFELSSADQEVVESIRHEMEHAMPLDIPVEVDAKIGPNWTEMTPIPRTMPA